MTKREGAILSAYTGCLLCDFNDFHKYIEELLGRPVFTHEIPELTEYKPNHFVETEFLKNHNLI